MPECPTASLHISEALLQGRLAWLRLDHGSKPGAEVRDEFPLSRNSLAKCQWQRSLWGIWILVGESQGRTRSWSKAPTK